MGDKFSFIGGALWMALLMVPFIVCATVRIGRAILAMKRGIENKERSRRNAVNFARGRSGRAA
jgi:hypothetical protein